MLQSWRLQAALFVSFGVLVACEPDVVEPTVDIEPTQIEAVQPDTPPEPEVVPQAAPADPAPTIIGQRTDTFNARAEFPFGLAEKAPALDARLREEALFEIEQLGAAADEDAAEGGEYFRPYDLGIEWEITAERGDLISLSGLTYANTGGAHPNYAITGIIHDMVAREDIALLDLFEDREGALSVIVPAVRGVIMREKMVRYGEEGEPTEARITETAESLPDHGRWLRNTFLVGANEGDGIGGFTVVFSPYDIGVYAEGSYEATIGQAVFRDMLKSDYRDLFAGTPAETDSD